MGYQPYPTTDPQPPHPQPLLSSRIRCIQHPSRYVVIFPRSRDVHHARSRYIMRFHSLADLHGHNFDGVASAVKVAVVAA